jgi:hypothetical protein
VVQFVDRVSQIQPSQQWIASEFSRAQNVSSAARFDFGEAEELSHAPARIAPDPPVNRPQYPIDAC